MKLIQELIDDIKKKNSFFSDITVVDFDNELWTLNYSVGASQRYICGDKINMIVSEKDNDRILTEIYKNYLQKNIPSFIDNSYTVSLVIPQSIIDFSEVKKCLTDRIMSNKSIAINIIDNSLYCYENKNVYIKDCLVTVTISKSFISAFERQDNDIEEKFFEINQYGRFNQFDVLQREMDNKKINSNFVFYDIETLKKFYFLYYRELTSPNITVYTKWNARRVLLKDNEINVIHRR